jgi:hypothetical protein
LIVTKVITAIWRFPGSCNGLLGTGGNSQSGGLCQSVGGDSYIKYGRTSSGTGKSAQLLSACGTGYKGYGRAWPGSGPGQVIFGKVAFGKACAEHVRSSATAGENWTSIPLLFKHIKFHFKGK